VAAVLGKQVAGEQVECRSAAQTVQHLDPKEILHRHIAVAINWAVGTVIPLNLYAQGVGQFAGGSGVGVEVDVFEFLTDNPGRHGIHVEALDVAADAVGLDQRCAAAHEGVSNPDARKIVALKEGFLERAITEFRQQ